MKTHPTKPNRSSTFSVTRPGVKKQIPISWRWTSTFGNGGTIKTALRLTIAAFGLALFNLSTATIQAEDYTYTTHNGTITITKYTGSGGAVTIPGTINGLPVISIGEGAFSWCMDLTRVTIPNSVISIGGNAFYACYYLTRVTVGNSVTSIGDRAFEYCFGLTNVTIPNSVTGIGIEAFIGCTSLTSVTLGNGVTSIGRRAFDACTSLTAITVDALNSVYGSVDGVLFNKSQDTLILCAGGKAGSYTIPTSVTYIGEWAFASCTSLTSVTIPNSVATIGEAAFRDCTNLTSVTIPNSVTSIGDWAFSACTAITVDTNNPAYSSADGILFNRSQTTLIQCPAGKAGNYTIPNSVATIGEAAFRDCTNLTSVTIPNSVTSIGDGAFSGCTSLSSVTIPDSVTSIGGQAFYQCTSLTSVTIGNSVTSIGDWAFSDCTSLTSVTIGNSVASIGGYAFGACHSLTSVTIPYSVASIGDSTFHFCTSLTAITVDSLNPIYSSLDGVLFNKNQDTLILCPAGKAGSYTIPDSVTNIRDGWYDYYGAGAAFAGCTRLTSVTIPGSVTNIGDFAFSGCTKLTGVYFKGNSPGLGDHVFIDYDNATVYYLPGTTGWGPRFGGRPTALWVLPNPLILNNGPSFGVQTNQFGFIISWATNLSVVVVEASTALVSELWAPLQTNILTGGYLYFSDPDWTNQPARFYRVRSP